MGGTCRAEGACTEDYYEADLALVRCYTCNRMGHLCCKGAPQDPPDPSCHNCGEAGHLAVDCSSFRPPQASHASPVPLYVGEISKHGLQCAYHQTMRSHGNDISSHDCKAWQPSSLTVLLSAVMLLCIHVPLCRMWCSAQNGYILCVHECMHACVCVRVCVQRTLWICVSVGGCAQFLLCRMWRAHSY